LLKLYYNFLINFTHFLQSANSEQVKNKLLEMVQEWGLCFKEKTNLKLASNLYNIMKAEGMFSVVISEMPLPLIKKIMLEICCKCTKKLR